MHTFAIYNWNWIILIGLTTLGVARLCLSLVSLNFLTLNQLFIRPRLAMTSSHRTVFYRHHCPVSGHVTLASPQLVYSEFIYIV